MALLNTMLGLSCILIVEKAKTKGSGWVDYKYLNPETNELEHKTTYLLKVGDLILCCGAYKEYSHEGD